MGMALGPPDRNGATIHTASLEASLLGRDGKTGVKFNMGVSAGANSAVRFASTWRRIASMSQAYPAYPREEAARVERIDRP